MCGHFKYQWNFQYCFDVSRLFRKCMSLLWMDKSNMHRFSAKTFDLIKEFIDFYRNPMNSWEFLKEFIDFHRKPSNSFRNSSTFQQKQSNSVRNSSIFTENNRIPSFQEFIDVHRNSITSLRNASIVDPKSSSSLKSSLIFNAKPSDSLRNSSMFFENYRIP